MFPEGIPIGVIDTFWREGGSNYFTVEAELINDISNVKYVYVINNLMKPEIDKLKNDQ